MAKIFCGFRIGKFTVETEFNSVVKTRGKYWLCRCDCGNVSVVSDSNLKKGNMKSCGHCKSYSPEPRFTELQLIQYVQRYGNRLKMIADASDVSKGTIMYWLRKYGLTHPKKDIKFHCKNCGKPVKQTLGRSGTKLYCNSACKNAFWTMQRRSREKWLRVCVYCGKEYETNRENRKCCDDCRNVKVKMDAIKRREHTLQLGKKLCHRCKKLKPLIEFNTHRKIYDGYTSYCRVCIAEKWSERKTAGKLKRNPESIKRSREHDRIRRRTDPKYRAHRREYEFMRRTTDPMFKLKNSIKFQVWKTLRDDGESKKGGRRWESLVGFTLEQLKSRLESQFTEGMSWSNYREWEIDHIIPVSFFNFKSSSDPEFRMCWALENLQPLWARHNLEKNAKLP